MPWTEQLPSGRFRACWRDDLGRSRSKSGFVQESAALRFAGEQESKVRRGEASTAGRSPKWGDWCDEWLGLRQVEPSTAYDDANRIKNHIRPQWGNARMAKIDREHVQAWVNGLTRDGMNPSTVRRVFYTFSSSMKAAVMAKRVPSNPCNHVQLPDSGEAAERYFTRDEIDAAIAQMVDPYRTAVLVLVGTGLRFSELAGLHWNRVNFTQRILTVAEQYVATGSYIKPYPKSKKPRHVPIPSWVMTELERRRDGDSRGCGMRHGLSKAVCRSGLVLLTTKGQPLDPMNMLRRHWKPAQERAGIFDVGRVHDLRHTYASWLVQDGIPLQEVQRLLGHASIVTTQRYAHFGDTAHASIVRALEAQGGRLLTLAPSLPHDPPAGLRSEA